MNKVLKMVIWMVLILVLFGVAVQAGQNQGIEGKNIILMKQEGKSLSSLIQEAGKRTRETYFLSGYFFEARSHSRYAGNYITSQKQQTSTIEVDEERLRINHYGSWDREETGEGKKPVLRRLLFLHKKKGSGSEIKDVTVLNEGLTYQLKGMPLYWFGTMKIDESMNFLKSLFHDRDEKMQKRVMSVIGFHNDPTALDFLYRVVQGNYSRSLRKNAVFWLGAVRDNRSLGYLKKIVSSEEDQDVRQQVVFALYLVGSKDADRELIKLARQEPLSNLRKKAVFWLGQRASKEAVKALKEIIVSEEVLSVKSSAVFAISQLPKDQAVPMLIDIARTHKSPKIRKKAIFWLGESGDDRAVSFFEKILFEK